MCRGRVPGDAAFVFQAAVLFLPTAYLAASRSRLSHRGFFIALAIFERLRYG